MLSMRSRLAFVLSVAGLLPAGSWAQNQRVQQKVTALTPAESFAALAQVPPGQVVVTYQNAELTVKARNAPLSDVLRAVCSQTGALIDIPSGTDEKILAILGPGPASDVLASLLKGSQFNYAMVGSTDNPNGVARLMLFPKTKVSKAETQVSQPTTSKTRVASIEERALPDKQIERSIQAQARTTNGAGNAYSSQAGNADVGDSDLAGMAADPNAVDLMRQIAAQTAGAAGTAAAAIDNSAADIDAPGANNPRVAPGGPRPPGRPRHRRR